MHTDTHAQLNPPELPWHDVERKIRESYPGEQALISRLFRFLRSEAAAPGNSVALSDFNDAVTSSEYRVLVSMTMQLEKQQVLRQRIFVRLGGAKGEYGPFRSILDIPHELVDMSTGAPIAVLVEHLYAEYYFFPSAGLIEWRPVRENANL